MNSRSDPASTLHLLYDRFPCIGLGWDNRETSTSASVGELLANCEAKLVAEDGETEIRDPEQRGELWVRGPNVMKGYWRNPAATRDTITPDGWLKTGDVAYRDAKNKFYIADRKKVSGVATFALCLADCILQRLSKPRETENRL